MPGNFYPNGVGGTDGDSLATDAPLVMFNGKRIWYVDSQTGTNGASPAGLSREQPLATLAQAQTNGADGDFVVFLSGHSETLVAALTISKNLTLIGEGTSGGLPTVTFTNNQTPAAAMFNVTADVFQMRNIHVAPNSAANSTARVLLPSTITFARFVGCYFESGEHDGGAAVSVDCPRVIFDQCQFVSTSDGSRPNSAIVNGAGAVGLVMLRDCVLDGGTVGWAIHAVDLLAGGGTVDYLICEGNSWIRGADIRSSAKRYHANETSTGAVRYT